MVVSLFDGGPAPSGTWHSRTGTRFRRTLSALDFVVWSADNRGVARVVIERLTKTFRGPKGERIRALEDVSLTIEDGQFLVVLGPSGCGKTSLLRLIAGLEEPTAGTISIAGRVVNRMPPKEREVAMVFQSPALYPHLTARENMAFGLKLRRVPRPEIERRVQETAELLGVTDCLQRPPMALSGGQRQRVALGRALVRRPAVFLLDEPLANLDPQLQTQLRTEISRLHHNPGATWIYVTHDQREAMTLGDRIAVLRQGTIQQVAEPLELYRQPINMFVADFIGSPAINFLEGTLALGKEGLVFLSNSCEGDQDPLRLKVHETMTPKLESYAGEAVVLALRAEHVAVETTPADTSRASTVGAVVESFEALGAETILHLASHGRGFAARIPGGTRVSRGEKVWLRLDLRYAHFFDPVSKRRIG